MPPEMKIWYTYCLVKNLLHLTQEQHRGRDWSFIDSDSIFSFLTQSNNQSSYRAPEIILQPKNEEYIAKRFQRKLHQKTWRVRSEEIVWSKPSKHHSENVGPPPW